MVLENLTSSQDHISFWKQCQACMIKYRSFQVIGQKKNFPLIINKSPSSSHTHDNQKFTAALHQAAVRFDRGKKLKDLSLSSVKTPTYLSLSLLGKNTSLQPLLQKCEYDHCAK